MLEETTQRIHEYIIEIDKSVSSDDRIQTSKKHPSNEDEYGTLKSHRYFHMTPHLSCLLFSLFLVMLVLMGIPALAQPMIKDPNLRVEAFAKGLNAPTSMAFLDSNHILVLEKNTGAVRLILKAQLQNQPVLTVPVDSTSERGLLGIATATSAAPTNKYVFLYYTDIQLRNKVYRYQWNG